jgi:hypothetical protein
VDRDGNGLLDRDELRTVLLMLGRKPEEIDMDATMLEIDEDGNEEVDQDEFARWFFAQVRSRAPRTFARPTGCSVLIRLISRTDRRTEQRINRPINILANSASRADPGRRRRQDPEAQKHLAHGEMKPEAAADAKPKEPWKCSICTTTNGPRNATCQLCGRERGHELEEEVPEAAAPEPKLSRGTFEVTILEAKDLKKMDFFGQNDPYCTIKARRAWASSALLWGVCSPYDCAV